MVPHLTDAVGLSIVGPSLATGLPFTFCHSERSEESTA